MSIFIKYDPWGRMGNRMFQFAFGKILSRAKTEILIAEPLPNFKNTFNYHNDMQPVNPISLRQKYGDNYVNIEEITSTNNDIIIDSYLQNYKYYDQYIPQIRKLFELNSQLNVDENELVVHIRETDYKLLKVTINKEYYYKKIKDLNYDRVTIITDDVNSETITFLKDKGFNILSDKPITEFKTYNDDNVMRDFIYMLKANHLFIAQSTFSWWAAFLGEHKNVYIPIINNGMWKENPGKNDINLCMDHFIKVKE